MYIRAFVTGTGEVEIKQTIEEAFGSKVDVVRLRENMNLTLKKRIERDVIYV